MSAADAPAGSAGRTPAFARLALFYGLFFAVTGAALPYLPVWLSAHGLTAGDIGAVLAVGMATKVVAPNLWAWLGDSGVPRMRLVRGGLLAALLTFGSLALTDGFWTVAAVLGLYGFVLNAVLPQFEVVTLEHLGSRDADYGRVRLWGSVGFVVSVFATGALTQVLGIAALVPLVAGLLALTALVAMRVDEPPRSGRARTSGASLAPVLRDRGVWAFLVAIALMQMSHGPFYAFFTLHLEALGFARTAVSALWVLGVVAEIGLFAIAPRLLARHDARALFVACCAATAVRWGLMALAGDDLAVLVTAQLLHAISFGLYHATAIHIVRRRFTGSLQGRGQALYSSIGFGVGGALGSFAGGQLWAAHGAGPSYAAAAGAALAAAIVVVLVRAPRAPASADAGPGGDETIRADRGKSTREAG